MDFKGLDGSMGERAIPEDLPSAREIIGTRGGDGGASPKVMCRRGSCTPPQAHTRSGTRAPQPLTKIY